MNNNEPIKLFNRLAIIDGSYFLHRSLKTPDLWELRNDDGERSGGVYGFLRIFNSEIKNLNYYPVCVWDAGLADRRLKAYPNYKRNLDKLVENMATLVAQNRMTLEEAIKNEEFKLAKLPEFSEDVTSIAEQVRNQINVLKQNGVPEEETPDDNYLDQYRRQRAILIEILESFGIPSIKVPGWEGDDLMTLLSRVSNESVVLTDDKDLQQLVAENIDIYRPMAKEWIKLDTLNDCVPRDLVITKAIVGDGSDNIPSVTASEERKFSLGLTRAWNVSKMIREHDEDPSKYLPYLESLNKNYYKGFIKHHDDYLRNMELVDLSLVENDSKVISDMESVILDRLGKGNLFRVLELLNKQGITTFDTNGLLQKIMMVSPLAKL